MSMILQSAEIDLRYIDGRRWRLLTAFAYQSDAIGFVSVPMGFQTDFNSIPRGLWNILPPDEYAQAGVVHDYLYRHGGVTRAQADGVHREILTLLGCPAWKRVAMYAGLRLGGWKPWNRYRAGA